MFDWLAPATLSLKVNKGLSKTVKEHTILERPNELEVLTSSANIPEARFTMRPDPVRFDVIATEFTLYGSFFFRHLDVDRLE